MSQAQSFHHASRPVPAPAASHAVRAAPAPLAPAGPPPAAAPAAAQPAARPQQTLPAAERHRERLLRYVRRLMVGDPHRAEDIVQETMLRAWLAADEFAGDFGGEAERARSDDRLAAWLHVVARNLAVDAHRRERSVPAGILPTGLLQQADERVDVAESVVNRVAVTRSLARLGPRHRDVLVHVHLCDRSRAETARILGIPRGTVKSRAHYALSALRREFPAV
ncbi:sigma-70 family RNA polymerase sigma factor [Streptomyces sp. DSM 44915]|uniref:Sigma-70 family RNA polymerase sigma factor n=1 Tax=Streptomyces chisholmiae TaxID=3075540 RepID=A0ABU2JYK2_9ACTN|nr:sigma-70 family RNA polymerase sigma factor [Streptomyces sp. DSM 44915]MDT0270070.1 sigma-70 family RNA polymerase sigma factor [Streptomyces sp. DSM 44915]